MRSVAYHWMIVSVFHAALRIPHSASTPIRLDVAFLMKTPL
jgi:hypothetical protein